MATTCIHSGFEDDCLSCWQRVAVMQERHIKRLRNLLHDLGGDPEVMEHDIEWFGSPWAAGIGS